MTNTVLKLVHDADDNVLIKTKALYNSGKSTVFYDKESEKEIKIDREGILSAFPEHGTFFAGKDYLIRVVRSYL